MIKLLETLMGLFGGKKGKLNDLMKMKKQASDVLDKHGDTIDQITDTIPGDTDDKLVDQARKITK